MLDLNTFYKMEEAEKQQVNVKMVYIDMTKDLIAGMLLSQIVYWNLPSKKGKSKLSVTYKGRKGIAKNRNDWWSEIRISPKQYDRAIKILADLKLVEVKNTMFYGKKTPVIMLNEDTFIKKYKETLTNTTVSPKGQNHNIDQRVKPLTETTTETTKNKNKNNIVHLTCTSYFSSFEDLEPELQNLVTNYEELYIQKTRYSHPRVTQSESNVVVENIDKFLELGGDFITLYKVIYNFFSKDLRYYNIKHCMSEPNLMMQLHRDGMLDADQVFNVKGKFELQV